MKGEDLVKGVRSIKVKGVKKKVGVAPKEAQALVARFPTGAALADATPEELTAALKEAEPSVIARSVREFLESEAGGATIGRLKGAGVDMTAETRARGPRPLEGKTVVITGTLERFSRTEAEEAVKAAGGRAASSVSKNTDFVVVGASPGSNAAKARQLGVKVIDEDEFLARIGKADGKKKEKPHAGGLFEGG